VNNAIEKLLWSIALPGFGQFLNGKVIKGIVFVILEFLVNVQANFNVIIISSFRGDIQKAISQADYQWLMFYPCLYFFAMWDAYKDAGGGKERYSFLPFVFSAYFVTVGCIYSSNFLLFGVLLGPVWLPMLSVIPGLGVGILIKKFLTKVRYLKTSNN
jgi:TM2 domain-containing membrane protein YozV